MLKAFVMSFIIMGITVLFILSGIGEVFAFEYVFYGALVLLAVVIGVAFIILGNPLNGLKDDDKKSD